MSEPRNAPRAAQALFQTAAMGGQMTAHKNQCNRLLLLLDAGASQTIELRDQRRRPAVPPETLFRPAYATACTARRASLTSEQADENRHYDRTRTSAFRPRHTPRPLEQQTVHIAPRQWST